MRRGKVEYSYNKFDKLMFKGVKVTKKGVLGLHQATLFAIGIAFKISEMRVFLKEIKKTLNTKEGKVVLKRVGAGSMAFFTVASGVGAITQISNNVPDARAAIVEKADELDLDNRYGQYDGYSENNLRNNNDTDVTYTEGENNLDNIVTILHNADGSEYSNQVLSATGEKLNEEGIDYYFANNNYELINDIKKAEDAGEKVNVVSIENGKNNYNQTLIASSFVREQNGNITKTNSENLRDEIVNNDPVRLYGDNGVASDTIEGERQAGIAQQAIIEERIDSGERLPVDTITTVRPSSQDIYNPEELGINIAEGITEYYSDNQITQEAGRRM